MVCCGRRIFANGPCECPMHCAVHCYSMILVNAKAVSTCPHIHTAAASTWSHVVLVEKNANATPKQKQKHIANPKSKAILKQPCGVP